MKNIILAEGGTSIVNAKKTAKKKYKCPYCEARVERSKLHIHIQNEHEDLIPEGYTALRVAFNAINNKTEGHCIICKGVTDWNEDKARYERLCNNPACHEAYKKIVAERTRKIYGTDRLQTDPAYADYVQRRALEGRKMSGKYTFADGGVLSYMGTYEKRFLEFMDTVMHAKSEDILAPGPSIKYVFQGQNHIYISDFFYVPYNLIIEIKDGGSNRNNHPKRLGEEEEKIKAKEKAVEDLKMFNYVRVTDNDFGQLLSVMALLKYQLYHPTYAYKDDYIIRVNEAASFTKSSEYNTSQKPFVARNSTLKDNVKTSRSELLEDMSGTIGAALPPARAKAPIVPTPSPMPYETDKDNYYVVQYPKNNAFAYGITKDPLQYSMVSVDPTEKGFYKVYKTDKGKINKKYLTFKIKDKQSGKHLYNELCKIAETSGKIFDSCIKYNYIYETLTEGNVILDPDQMMFDSRFELVDNPKEQERKSMAKIYNWLKGGNLDKLQEQVDELESSQKGEYAYHVLPDGEMSIDQLKQWEHDYLMMPYDQRIISNDISTEKYGSDNLTRYKEKYSKKLQGTNPEKVDIEEASSMIQTQSEDAFTFGADELDRVKSVECDSSIIIMVLTDRNYGFDEYTSEDIDDLKEKWNRYNALPQQYRVLSSQTAMNIFGLDNDNLFNKAINIYLSKQKHSDDPTESQFSTNECVMPYYIPSDKVLKTNPEGIFNESGYIDPYKYAKTLQIMSHSLKCAKTEADRAAIREQIIDYGWNPEIPCTESALRKSYMRFEPIMIQEIDAQSLLESADSNGFTSEYLKDKIVPIFVVLVQGNHLHSKGIRLFTNSNWSHAALSLDSSLDKMYTFRANINDPDNKDHKTGFAIDTVEEYLKDNPHMKSKVYALFITPEQKATIASAINWYIKHQNDTSYGFKNVINILLNRKTKYKNKYEDKCKMVCSQFVYAMLSLVNFKMKNNKDGSTVSPADIDELSNDARFYVVYQGGIDKYDQFKVNDLCYKLLPKLPMEMYGINESTGEAFGKPKSVIGKSSSIARIFEMASEMLENF